MFVALLIRCVGNAGDSSSRSDRQVKRVRMPAQSASALMSLQCAIVLTSQRTLYTYITLTTPTSSSNKRKIGDECRVVQEEWTSLYLFSEIQLNQLPQSIQFKAALWCQACCYIWCHSRAASKWQNNGVEEKTSRPSIYISETKCGKWSAVKVRHILSGKNTVSKWLVHKGVHGIGYCRNLISIQRHVFSKVSLSGVSVARRIEAFAGDIENSLKHRASKFVFYSVAVDDTVLTRWTLHTLKFLSGRRR